MTRRGVALLFWSGAAATVVSVAVAAAPVAWRLIGADGPLPALAQRGPADKAQARARPDLEPILAFSPFGQTVRPAEAELPVGETRLVLTLLGITLAQSDAASRAIVAGGDLPVASYAIGQAITPVATLAEIHADHVLLLVDGRTESLSFAPPAGTAPVATGSGPDLANLIPQDSVTDTAAAPPRPDADAVIAQYRAEIAGDVQGVLDRLGLEATANGYLVAGTPSAGVRQAGFRPGDLVTTVNGRAVGNVDADRLLFDDVALSGRASIEVERDGQTIVMTFPLR